MKRVSGLTIRLLAIALLITNMIPGAILTVYATEQMVKEVSAYPQSGLQVGDRMNVWVTVEGIEEKKDDEGNKIPFVLDEFYVDFSGAVNTSTAPKYVDTQGNDVLLQFQDMRYTGERESVDIEVWYDGKELPVYSVELVEDSEILDDAGSVLKLTTKTVNAVAGEVQRITLTLKNEGSVATGEGEMKLSIPKASSTSKGIKIRDEKFDIPVLKRNEEKEFQVTLDVASDVTHGIHEMEVDINGTTQIVNIRVDSAFMPPSLEVTASGTDSFKADQPKDLTLHLKNVGHSDAKNVKVEIVQSDNVYVMDGSSVRYLESIESGETSTLSIKLQLGSDEISTVPVQLKMTYIDDNGEQKEDVQYIYLSTEGGTIEQGVRIENIISPEGVYKPGDTYVLQFTVLAPEDIENVQIRVSGSDTLVPLDQNLFIIAQMAEGEKKQFMTTFTPTSHAKSETHLMEIQVSYPLNSNLEEHSQFATVQVNNPDEDDDESSLKGTPKVIIGEYQSSPVVVQAGETFDLEVGFLNTHATQSVHNLKANITIREEGDDKAGTVFTPVGASNTFYISSMMPGEMVTKDISMYTIPTATPKTYEVLFELEYEDAEGNQITANEYIGIPVEQVTKLEVVEVVTEYVEVGRESSMRVQLFNKGKTDIRNIMISTVGEGFVVEDNKMTEGILEQGNILYYEPTLYPYQDGTLEGQIIIEYEDVNGQIHTMVEEFEMEVMPAFEADPWPEDDIWGMDMLSGDMEEEKPSKLPSLLGVGIGIALAALITAIVSKKRKAKRDEMLEDDED